jgi:hypothetical protein
VGALLGAFAGAPYAAAANETPAIERVWSFSGGAVAVQAQPDGSFTGTVVEETKFAECPHPVGQPMWTEMRLQPDGSYFGDHVWYFVGQKCQKVNPMPGPTAWRVLQGPKGPYLLVCFSPPGGTQPTISPTGLTENVGYKCFSSAEIEQVPTAAAAVESFTQTLSAPPSTKKACLSRRSFRVHVDEPRYEPYRTVTVMLGRRRLAIKRHGRVFTATVDLAGMPTGTFTLKVRVTTVLGRHLAGSRTYHTCALKSKSTKPLPLKPARHR